ncbi:MAG: ATP-binding cassette domain-containing protein, partial [Candidatus Riflebacteria bacterium]
MKTSIMLEVENVGKTYSAPGGDFIALQGVSFTAQAGEIPAIVGRSGSGKSTLLNMLTGIDHPTQGFVRLMGRDIHRLNESELSVFRGANIGIVFQFNQLIPTLTILENILIAMDFVNKIPR